MMSRFKWCPTSNKLLREAEDKVLSNVLAPLKGYYVNLDENGTRLWTIQIDPLDESCGDNLPLVLVHGFGGGSALWTLNFDSLSHDRRVYSFDVLGFARSDRPRLSSDPLKIEQSFINSIEAWRKAVNLDNKFILLGHSFGAYLALVYAMKFPDHIIQLICCDPWGISSSDLDYTYDTPAHGRPVPDWVITTANILFKYLEPLSLFRIAGPMGPVLMQLLRTDLKSQFKRAIGEEGATHVLDYIYHCNARMPPTGEIAFQCLSARIGLARNPIINRITQLSPSISLHFVYGADSWVDKKTAFEVRQVLVDRTTPIHVIEGASHHVYSDRFDEFNQLVNSICRLADLSLRAEQNSMRIKIRISRQQ